MPRQEDGFFTAKDNTRLYWKSELPDGDFSAVVAIVHGYGDHLGRYAHVMDGLVAQGFGTIAFDYRGHGKADGNRADCNAWSDYLGDLEVFLERARALAGSKPLFVLAHSHGALMATHWAFTGPSFVKGVILSAPFYRMAFEAPKVKVLAARVVKGLLPGLHMSNELEVSQLSRDEAWQKKSAEDPLYLHVTTPRWFFEMLGAQKALDGRGKDFKLPVLVCAGNADPIAATPVAKAFFDTMGSTDKTWKEYDGFRHEVLNEIGKEQVLADISSWISAHR